MNRLLSWLRHAQGGPAASEPPTPAAAPLFKPPEPASPPASELPPEAIAAPVAGAPALYRIYADDGSRCLTLHADGLCVGRPARSGEAVSDLVLYCPRGTLAFGFLMARDAPFHRVMVGTDPLQAELLSYVLDNSRRAERVALRSPNGPTHICAVPASVSPRADLNCNRTDPGGWETFGGEPIGLEVMSPRARELISHLEAFYARSPTGRRLVAWMDAMADDVLLSCLQSMLRLLDRDDLLTFARRLLEDPALRDRMGRLYPDDRWFTQLIPELIEWDRTRAGEGPLVLDQSWDHLQHEVHWNRFSPLGEILFVLIREQIEPRHEICVMTTARNEGIYFLEWIAHHLAIGVEHFIVYSNDNNDGSDELLAELARMGLVTWVSNKVGRHVDLQTRAYKHCLTYLRKPLDYRWTVLIDLDEFVTFDKEKYASFDDYLRFQSSRGAEAVAMHWLMFTPSQQVHWRDAPLIERFDRCEPNNNRAVKTAFRSAAHTGSFPHNPVASYRRVPLYLDAAGRVHHGPGSPQPHAHEGEPTFVDAWISHYFFKSLDEFIWKMSRGFDLRADLRFDIERMVPFIYWFDDARTIEDKRTLPFLEGQKRELARLRAMPALADAETASRAVFRERVDAMRREAIRTVQRSPGLDEAVRERMLVVLKDGLEPEAPDGTANHSVSVSYGKFFDVLETDAIVSDRQRERPRGLGRPD